MSAHYQNPTSIPSDYALISRYPDQQAGDEQDKRNKRMSSPRPKKPKITHQTMPYRPLASENTPLLKTLSPFDPRIDKFSDDRNQMLYTCWEELCILSRYALPVFGTQFLDFSLIMAPVISVGHLSTSALAALTLGSMTANVTAFSILQGFASALDTMLPSAWTSSQPQLVGLWTQRMVWGPRSIRLGFIGAPIATAVSFNLVSVMSIVYGVFYVPKTAWHPLDRRMFTNLGVLVPLGFAGVGQTASEWCAWELVALAASLMGSVALATQSVLLSSASMTFQAPFALSVAASVRIGNLLGEGNAKRAGIASNTSIIMALALSLITRNQWAYLFNDDSEVVSLVASILPLVALFQVFDGNAAVTDGILRARGKQVGFIADNILE
ncbi:hypothetical protein C0992_000912 [Termitomyces sp. T32_za158]|nr:hypothetical protein C0992_000912 [Termitomyces sp. T32_za158]